MNLSEGYEKIKSQNIRSFRWKDGLEKDALEIRTLISEGNNTKPVVQWIRSFLMKVECWKNEFRTYDFNPNVASNKDDDIWNCIRETLGYLDSSDDKKALIELTKLSGFQARTASAVLRFLSPKDWGTVDWRNASIFEIFEMENITTYSINEAIKEKYKKNKVEFKKQFNKEFEQNGISTAIRINSTYKEIVKIENQFNYAADIDLAIYGLSFYLWEFDQ
jgi:hypothetical protein